MLACFSCMWQLGVDQAQVTDSDQQVAYGGRLTPCGAVQGTAGKGACTRALCLVWFGAPSVGCQGFAGYHDCHLCVQKDKPIS